MKKIIIIILMILFIPKLKAIENIKIDNKDLIPKFNKNTKYYNYYTNKEEIEVFVDRNNNSKGNKKYILNNMQTDIIVSSDNIDYIIHVFKKYDKNYKEESYIKNISIKGYNLNFDKNVFEYKININDEENLDINFELSNQDDKLVILGNGNFNKTDNIIKIILNDKDEYIIHAYKTMRVSNIEKEKIVKEISPAKKEIVIIIMVTISCILVSLFFYLVFINQHYLRI